MHKMITIISLLLVVLVSGCSTIVHKEYQSIVSVKGGKITATVDPKTETLSPEIILGEILHILTTVPIGGKLVSKIITYNFFTGEKSVEYELNVDATQVPIEVLRVHTDYKEPEPVEVYAKEKIK